MNGLGCGLSAPGAHTWPYGLPDGDWDLVVEREIQRKNVHPRFTEDSQAATFGELINQPADSRRFRPPGPGNTVDLRPRRRRTDVGIQTAAAGGEHVGRNRTREIGV